MKGHRLHRSSSTTKDRAEKLPGRGRFLLFTSWFFSFVLFLQGCSSPPDSESHQLFSEGRHREAMQKLSEKRPSLSAGRYHLNKAYIERGRGNLEASNNELGFALKRLATNERELLLEITLNQLLNSYIQKDFAQLHKLLTSPTVLLPNDSPWLALFSGIDFANEGREVQALAAWQQPWPNSYLSVWMETAFNSLLPYSWRELEIARLFLRRGDTSAAIGKLESLRQESITPTAQLEIDLLEASGLLQQAAKQANNRSLDDYEKALDLLNGRPLSEPFEKNPDWIAAIQSLLAYLSQSLDEGGQGSFPQLTELLSKREELALSHRLLDGMIALLLNRLAQGDVDGAPQLEALLEKLLPMGEKRHYLVEQLYGQLYQELLRGEYGKVQWLIELLQRLERTPFTPPQRQALSQAIWLQLTSQLRCKQIDFSRANQLALLWRNLEADQVSRLDGALQLLPVAKRHWNTAQGRAQLLPLLQIAFYLVPDNRLASFKRRVEKLLEESYHSAIIDHDFEALHSLLAVVNHFGLAPVSWKSPQEVATLLADGQLLYEQQQWQRAYAIANWLLHIDPSNEQVRLLFAMASYQLGNYQQALPLLRSIPKRSRQLQVAHALSEVAAGDRLQGITLLHSLPRDAINEELLQRLAIADLQQGHLQAASCWLHVNQGEGGPWQTFEQPTSRALLMIIAHAGGDYEQLLELYAELPNYLQQSPILTTLALLAAIQLDERALAAELSETLRVELKGIHFRPERDPALAFPLNLLLPAGDNLLPSPYYALALYCKLIEEKPKAALNYFHQLKNSSGPVLLEQAQTFAQLGRYQEALQLVLPRVEEYREKCPKELWEKVVTAVAEWHEEEQEWVEAAAYWDQLLHNSSEKPPGSLYYRYGRALLKQRRYANALEPLVTARKLCPADATYQLALIETLVHLGRFASANALSSHLLDTLPLDGDQLTQLALLLQITQDQSLYERALAQLSQLSPPPRLHAQLELAIASADWEKARELFDRLIVSTDGASTETLQCLSRTASLLGEDELARKYGLATINAKPHSYAPLAFLLEQRLEPPVASLCLERLLPRYKQNKLGPTSCHLLTLALIDQAIQQVIEGHYDDAKSVPAFAMALQIAHHLTEQEPAIASFQLTLGQLLFLAGEEASALASYNRAFSYDPSYSAAYKHAAAIWHHRAQEASSPQVAARGLLEASQLLEQALTFSPHDGEAWRLLGETAERLGRRHQALVAYQQGLLCAPNDPLLSFGLAKLLAEEGEVQRSTQLALYAQNKSPSHSIRQQIAHFLEQLSSKSGGLQMESEM